MKKAVAAFVAVASIAASAAWEKAGSLQVADMATQGAAVAKVGSFVGSPLAAAGMAAAIADSPLLKFFGPMRDKTPMSFVLFLDGDALSADPSGAFGSLEFAVLYPVSLSGDEFARRHPGSSSANGVIAVKGDMFDADCSNKTTYVVFSDDGRWVGAGAKPEQARLALADIPVAAKSMDGDVVRLWVDEKAFGALAAMAKAGKGCDAEAVSSIESCKSASIGVRVSDAGIDVRCSASVAEGCENAKCGLKPLGQAPLAFAGKDAFFACAEAEDSGSAGRLTEQGWARAASILAKHGLDVRKFVSMAASEKGYRLLFDVAAMCKTAREADGAPFDGFDLKGFLEDVQKAKSARKFSAKAPAYALAGVAKGFVPQWPVEERFAATLPEAASKKPYAVSFFSFSSLLKAVASESLASVPEERRAMMKPVLDQLASEAKCGCACMSWRQGDAHRVFLRISADECRSIGGLVTAAMMFGMECGPVPGGPCCGDDGDDDDD